MLTGAFHEDAVADCCDAFGGGWTRDDVLRILKDSRVGAFGVVGLGLAVALRGGATAALPAGRLAAAVVASAALGRWAILPAMALLPPSPTGPASAATSAARSARGAWPSGRCWRRWAACRWPWIIPGRLALMVLAVGGLMLAVVRYVRRRLGGMTGDCLGFLAYAGQVAALLVAAGEVGR